MPTEPFALKPPFCLPRPGIITREVKKKLRPARQPGDAAVLTRALAAFGLSPENGFKRLEGAVRNEPWLVRTRAGKKVLKRYKPSLRLKQIVYEHSILEHLAQRDFPSARLNHTADGNTIAEVDGRFYAVIDYLEGYFQFHNCILLPGQEAQFIAAEGSTLGYLHHALEGFTPDGISLYGFQMEGYGRGIGLDWYLENFRGTLEKANAKRNELQDPVSRQVLERAEWMQREVQAIENELEASPLKKGTVHGDYGPHNLLFKVGSPVVALDFELSRRDWLLVDLISALSRSTEPIGPQYDTRGITPMLAAYHAVFPHGAESYRLLPQIWLYQVIRRLWVAWGEYVEKGSQARLVETRRRLERLDWILRFQEELSNVEHLLEDRKIALDIAGQAGYTTRNKPR